MAYGRSLTQENDELVTFVIPALYLHEMQRKRPCHTSILTGKKFVTELLEGHELRCLSEFRMEPHIFKSFCNHLRVNRYLSGSRGIMLEEKIGMFLYMFARNASNRALQERFQHSGETIHRHIQSFLDVLPQLTYDFVKLPSYDPYSIAKCIELVTTMKELSSTEKVQAFDVFISSEHRQIFLSAPSDLRLHWLRRKICPFSAMNSSVHPSTTLASTMLASGFPPSRLTNSEILSFI